MNPKKISRICWNTNDWVKPSGREGKSKNKDKDGNYVFEWENGYGHEEWLFDLTKIINCYHYGFLETINKYRSKYAGEVFDISLYTMNSITREKFWIGEIKNTEVLSNEEGTEIFGKYKKHGWFNEMIADVRLVKGKGATLKNISPRNFFNIRFRTSNLKLLREPQLIAKGDKAIKAYYYTLLDKKIEPKLVQKAEEVFKFKSGLNPKKERTFRSHRRFSKSIELEHNKIQQKLYSYLCKEHGKKNVGTENPTGFGSRIDLVVKNKSKLTFYELKTGINLLSNVRDALSQLLEYCYYPDKINAKELVIVSLLPTNDKIEKYLKNIRDNFGIPIFYRQFDNTKEILV